MIVIIALLTFVSTLLGGLAALRFKDKLHLVLGFSAGAVIGVAFFDLLPESLELGQNFYDTSFITTMVALGFVTYLLLDRIVFLHYHEHIHDQNCAEHHSEEVSDHHSKRGFLGAGTLTLHSFLDGIAIGLAFQVSAAIGAIVATAVLVHDFSDGVNTVNMVLKNQGKNKTAFYWLLVDAAAPVLGAISTMFFALPEKSLGIILALFTGFFIYIGASDLIPESHHSHPKFLTTFMTVIGAALLYVAISLAGI